MPSNKELISQVEKLSDELGLEVVTKGLNNDELAELMSDLKAKKKYADSDDQFEPEAKEEKPPYYVMPGKAITSKRRILGDGDEIKADDLAGGKEALDAFVKSGHVGKA